MANFRVGQRVVCVDSSAGEFSGLISLAEGVVYTISKIDPAMFTGAQDGVWVSEVVCPGPCGYRANRFRPVVERKTDISIFTKMLTPQQEKVRA